MASSKTLKKQLALALIMILIGIVVIGGATYAWFALNNQISASGINVTATTEGANFEITAETGIAFKKSGGGYITDGNGNTISTVEGIINLSSANDVMPVTTGFIDNNNNILLKDNKPITYFSTLKDYLTNNGISASAISVIPICYKDASGNILTNGSNIITSESDVPTGTTATKYTMDGQPIFRAGQTEADIEVTSAITMYPTHPVFSGNGSGTSITWMHAFSDNYKQAQWSNSGTALDVVSTATSGNYEILKATSGTSDKYALIGTYYVRLHPDKDSTSKIINVKASNVTIAFSDDSTLNDAQKNLAKCVRLVVACENTYEIGAAGSAEIADNTGSLDARVATATTTSGNLVNELAASTGNYATIKVYAFFDGTDDNCKSENFTAKDINITVDFSGEITE